MSTQAVVQGMHAIPARWVSKKAMRAALLVGALVTVSIAVNAVIILAVGAGLPT